MGHLESRHRCIAADRHPERVVGAGHFVQVVAPEQVNPMIDRFLALTLAGHPA